MHIAFCCLVLAGAACAPGAPAEGPPSPGAAAGAGASRPAAQVVNATILANECQGLGRANAQLAETAMYQLVEG